MNALTRSSVEAPTDRRMPAALLLITVLVVASTLRAPITSVGSILGLISEDTGLSAAQLGLLGAMPLAAFAVVSPLVHHLSRRVGAERAVLIALFVLTGATVLRSVPGWTGWLWIGTAVLGAAIAIGNVLVPAIVKRDFPTRIAASTGAYSAVLSAFAALASGLALPIAAAFGWRVAIGVWAGLSLIGALVWLTRSGAKSAAPSRQTIRGSRSMWSSWTAWQVALFMAAQSTTFYLMITWLPTVEVQIGQSALAAGWHLFAFQVVGIFAGLAVPLLMHGRGDQRAVAAAVSALMFVSMIGLLLTPTLVIVWVILAGASAGASLVVALTLVAQRARTSEDAGRLSGMVQSIGYALATVGPIGAGLLLEWTGAWQSAMIAVAAVAALQSFVGLLAGRDRFTHDL
jgi:CP family cyanate transporter-like MFS transporter